MLKLISIQNFRLFRDLKIDPLSRVNLIAGKNNSGKTALLEAIYLLFADSGQFFDFSGAFRNRVAAGPMDEQRNPDDYASFWMWLHHQKDASRGIDINATDSQGDLYRVVLPPKPYSSAEGDLNFEYFRGERNLGYFNKRPSQGTSNLSQKHKRPGVVFFSAHTSHLSEDAELFSRLVVKRGLKDRLLDLLRVVEPRLEDLNYLSLRTGFQPQVYVQLDIKEALPLSQLGQGFARLLRYFSAMLAAEQKIVLIDEIENGIHHTALVDLWKGIAAIARQEDLQIFATTHSWECIQAAHEVFEATFEKNANNGAQTSLEYDFALHRLQRVKGEIQAVTHDRQMIEVAAQSDLEIR